MLGKPGATIPLFSTTADPATGQALDSSALSWQIFRNGTDITNGCNVATNTDLGSSPAGAAKSAFTIPTTGNSVGASVEGDQIHVIETATVNGVSASRLNSYLTVVARLPGELALSSDMAAVLVALNSTGVVLAGSQGNYAPAKAGDAMTLTGDLTATMKTSVTTAATAATPTVSVGPVTLATSQPNYAPAKGSDVPSAGTIAGAVWTALNRALTVPAPQDYPTAISYSGNNISTVTWASGKVMTYHYTNGVLTGISEA